LSAAEREAERESERNLSVVEVFGSKGKRSRTAGQHPDRSSRPLPGRGGACIIAAMAQQQGVAQRRLVLAAARDPRTGGLASR
jgi:hypothetical protein